MRAWDVIDCTTLYGTSGTVFGPAFVAAIWAIWLSVWTGRTHDYIRSLSV